MTNTEKSKEEILNLRRTLDGLLWLLEDYPELSLTDEQYEELRNLFESYDYQVFSIWNHLYKQVLPKIIERYHEEAAKRHYTKGE